MSSFGSGYSWPSGDTATTTAHIDPRALEFLGGVVFGSTALGCTTSDSDFDIAIDLDTIDAMGGMGKLRGTPLLLLEYFDVIPTDNVAYLIKDTINGVDIIVFEHKATLEQFKLAVEATKRYDPLLLTDKPTRIKIFENELLIVGFVPRRFISKIIHNVHKLCGKPYHKIPPVQLEPTLTF